MKQTLEIFGNTGLTRETVEEYWWTGDKTVVYRERDIIDEFYPAVDELLAVHMAEGVDCQECYLAYDPAADLFVMGFDTWFFDEEDEHNSGFGYQYFAFKYDPTKNTIKDVKTQQVQGAGIYPKGRANIRNQYPNMIELRLD